MLSIRYCRFERVALENKLNEWSPVVVRCSVHIAPETANRPFDYGVRDWATCAALGG